MADSPAYSAYLAKGGALPQDIWRRHIQPFTRAPEPGRPRGMSATGAGAEEELAPEASPSPAELADAMEDAAASLRAKPQFASIRGFGDAGQDVRLVERLLAGAKHLRAAG